MYVHAMKTIESGPTKHKQFSIKDSLFVRGVFQKQPKPTYHILSLSLSLSLFTISSLVFSLSISVSL